MMNAADFQAFQELFRELCKLRPEGYSALHAAIALGYEARQRNMIFDELCCWLRMPASDLRCRDHWSEDPSALPHAVFYIKQKP